MHFSAVKRDCNPVSHASVTPVPPAGTAEWRANALFIVRYTLLTGTEGSPGTPCSVSTPSALSYDKRFPLGDPPPPPAGMLHAAHTTQAVPFIRRFTERDVADEEASSRRKIEARDPDVEFRIRLRSIRAKR